MPASSRLMALAGVGALAASALTGAIPAHAASASKASKAGRSGAAITLGHHLSMTSDTADIATDKNGTAYVGWISSSGESLRTINLCVLPSGARTCAHGIQSIGAIDGSTAADLKILIVGGVPTLYWTHDNEPAAENGPNGAGIAAATVSATGVLNPGADVTTAPSHGTMFDTEVAPNGKVWAITQQGSEPSSIEVDEGLGTAPVTVNTPWTVERAQVAWDHGKAIIAVAKGGSAITTPPEYSASAGSTFPAFKPIGDTWPVGTDIGLVNAGGHVRFVTGGGGKAETYSPYVATWTGSTFGAAKSNGDKNAAYPTSHDVGTDASGRMVDVENEGGKITVNNYANDKTAAIYRFSSGGTDAGPSAQIATTPRGNGWVLWAIEDSAAGGAGEWLRVVPIRLSDTHQTVTKHGKHGTVLLTGPSSCLPAVSISDHVKASAKSGWKAGKKTIKLAGHKIGSSINGAALTAGKTYTLTGTVVFKKKSGSGHSAVTARLKFKSCSN